MVDITMVYIIAWLSCIISFNSHNNHITRKYYYYCLHSRKRRLREGILLSYPASNWWNWNLTLKASEEEKTL